MHRIHAMRMPDNGHHSPARQRVTGLFGAETSYTEAPGAALRRSASTSDFVRFRGRHYHQVLKAKFGLTDR